MTYDRPDSPEARPDPGTHPGAPPDPGTHPDPGAHPGSGTRPGSDALRDRTARRDATNVIDGPIGAAHLRTPADPDGGGADIGGLPELDPASSRSLRDAAAGEGASAGHPPSADGFADGSSRDG